MPRSYGLDYETGWDMAHDPQMRPAEAEEGICPWCGGVYPVSELERNEGLCLICFYASLEPDLDDGDDDTGDGDTAGRQSAPQENAEGGGDNAEKREIQPANQ